MVMNKNSKMTDLVNRAKRMKKEDYIVLVLVGILLVVIALPTEKPSDARRKNGLGESMEATESSEIFLDVNQAENGQKTAKKAAAFMKWLQSCAILYSEFVCPFSERGKRRIERRFLHD